MFSDEDKSKMFKYGGLHPLALRSTQTEIERHFEHVNMEEPEFSTGEEVLVKDMEEEKGGEESEERSSFFKKASVALAGGSMVAVGIPMVPLPGPGLLVTAGGLSVLATEFPAAQRLLDKGTNKIREFADSNDDEEDSGFVVIDEANINVPADAFTDLDTTLSPNSDSKNNEVTVSDDRNEGSIWPNDKNLSPSHRRKIFLKNTQTSMRKFAKGKILPMIEKMNNHEEKPYEQELVSHIAIK